MVQRHSQNVSLAHRPNAQYAGVGGNFRVEMAIETRPEASMDFKPYHDQIKNLLDHQCLCAKPSSLEAIARLAAGEIFQTEPQAGRWSSLTVWELDRYACTIYPDFSMSLTVNFRNLTLTTNGGADVSAVTAHVDSVFESLREVASENEFMWGRRLFGELAAGIPGLKQVIVDLGRHRSLRLADEGSDLR